MKKLICSIALVSVVLSVCSAQTFSIGKKDPSKPSIEKCVLPPPPSHGSKSTSRPSYSTSSSSNTFADALADFFIDLWFINTILVSFDDYPYANGNKYIHFGVDPLFETDDTSELLGSSSSETQFYRFAVDTSAFYFPGRSAGNLTRAEGLIWKFFGPIIQFETTVPFSNNMQNQEKLNLDFNLQLGLQMSIVQTNPFSLYWAIAWDRMQLSGSPAINGLAFQLIARSYVTKPVIIEWRGSIINLLDDNGNAYSENINWDSHLEIGVMVNGPLEVFAAWRYLGYFGFGYTANGVEIGARYHF